MTQAMQLLSRIRQEGTLYSWQITNEMQILQYNARWHDARKIIGCTCHKNKLTCTATEHIISEKDNKFIHITDQLPEKKEFKPMTQQTQPNYTYGYQKFQEAGKRLKTNQPKRQYEDLTTEELETKKQTAESWLEANKTNTNYAEALRRYEQICDELTYRQAKEALL